MLGIASDHAGFEMKEELKKFLKEKGYEVKDFGTHSPESMDYPDVAHPLAESVEKGEVSQGIALCGSGNGISMTLNKHQGIRAALCWSAGMRNWRPWPVSTTTPMSSRFPPVSYPWNWQRRLWRSFWKVRLREEDTSGGSIRFLVVRPYSSSGWGRIRL